MGKDDSKSLGGNGQSFSFTGPIGQLNINVDTVNNYGDGGQGAKTSEKADNRDVMDLRDLTSVRDEIIKTVSVLTGFVTPDWKRSYLRLWDGLLSIPEIEAQIYDPGQQKGTEYNRNLLANIIHYLGTNRIKGSSVYGDYNATYLTKQMGFKIEHPIRGALGHNPSAEIVECLKKYIEGFKL